MSSRQRTLAGAQMGGVDAGRAEEKKPNYKGEVREMVTRNKERFYRIAEDIDDEWEDND